MNEEGGGELLGATALYQIPVAWHDQHMNQGLRWFSFVGTMLLASCLNVGPNREESDKYAAVLKRVLVAAAHERALSSEFPTLLAELQDDRQKVGRLGLDKFVSVVLWGDDDQFPWSVSPSRVAMIEEKANRCLYEVGIDFRLSLFLHLSSSLPVEMAQRSDGPSLVLILDDISRRSDNNARRDDLWTRLTQGPSSRGRAWGEYYSHRRFFHVDLSSPRLRSIFFATGQLADGDFFLQRASDSRVDDDVARALAIEAIYLVGYRFTNPYAFLTMSTLKNHGISSFCGAALQEKRSDYIVSNIIIMRYIYER